MRGHKNQWKQLQGLTPLKGRAGCNISLQRLDWSFGLCRSESLCPTMPSGPCLLCCYKIVNISWICYCTKTLVELLVCILRNKINTCVQDSQIWIPPPKKIQCLIVCLYTLVPLHIIGFALRHVWNYTHSEMIYGMQYCFHKHTENNSLWISSLNHTCISKSLYCMLLASWAFFFLIIN